MIPWARPSPANRGRSGGPIPNPQSPTPNPWRCTRPMRPSLTGSAGSRAGEGAACAGAGAAAGHRHAYDHRRLAGDLAGDARRAASRQRHPELGARAEPAGNAVEGRPGREEHRFRLRHDRDRLHRQHVSRDCGWPACWMRCSMAHRAATAPTPTTSRSSAAPTGWRAPSGCWMRPATTPSTPWTCPTCWTTPPCRRAPAAAVDLSRRPDPGRCRAPRSCCPTTGSRVRIGGYALSARRRDPGPAGRQVLGRALDAVGVLDRAHRGTSRTA